jgi:hypothetical protein
MSKSAAVVLVVALVSGTAFANDTVPENQPESEERSPVWLGAFIASSTVFVGSLSLYLYGGHRVDEEASLVQATDIDNPQDALSNEDCNNENIVDRGGHFRSACTWSNRTRIAGPVILASGLFAIVTGYLAFRAQPKKEKRSVAFVPTVTTQSAGAMLDVHW